MNGVLPDPVMLENIKSQRTVQMMAYKMECKKEAIRAANSNKPYSHPGYGIDQITQPHYDLIAESEKIYKWLIKDIEDAQ